MNLFINTIFKHGLSAMFFFILIEYSCFPISSEIILPFSGAVASLQHISYLIIFPVSVVAGLLGTSLCYFIGSSCIGISLWNSLLIGLGYILREKWYIVSGYYNDYKHIYIVAIPIIIVVIILHFRNKH